MESSGFINVLHPGYNFSNLLLAFPRFDPSDNATLLGVHHGTVLVASQIVANNAFSGYLALDANGLERVEDSIGLDGILMQENYYFVVPGQSECYHTGSFLLD
jgi:hypothetical protein